MNSILTFEKKQDVLGKIFFHDSWAAKTVFPINFFENVKEVNFENINLIIPKEYDKILSKTRELFFLNVQLY